MATDEPVFEDEIAPKKGMSTTAKVVLVMLGIGSVALLLCCGGLFGAGIWMQRTLKVAVVTNPVEVQQVADEIVSMKLPDNYRAETGMRLPMVQMRMATFVRTDNPQVRVVVMENNMAFNPSDKEARDRLLDQMKMQTGTQGANVADTEIREIEIEGESVPFQFSTLEKNGTSIRQVLGFVPLKTGTVLVVIVCPQDSFDEDEVLTILQSIGEPRSDTGDTTNPAPATEANPQQPDPVTPSATGNDTPPGGAPQAQPAAESESGTKAEAETPEPATLPQ